VRIADLNRINKTVVMGDYMSLMKKSPTNRPNFIISSSSKAKKKIKSTLLKSPIILAFKRPRPIRR